MQIRSVFDQSATATISAVAFEVADINILKLNENFLGQRSSGLATICTSKAQAEEAKDFVDHLRRTDGSDCLHAPGG